MNVAHCTLVELLHVLTYSLEQQVYDIITLIFVLNQMAGLHTKCLRYANDVERMFHGPVTVL